MQLFQNQLDCLRLIYHDDAVPANHYTVVAIKADNGSEEFLNLFNGTDPIRAVRPYIYLNLNDVVFGIANLIPILYLPTGIPVRSNVYLPLPFASSKGW